MEDWLYCAVEVLLPELGDFEFLQAGLIGKLFLSGVSHSTPIFSINI